MKMVTIWTRCKSIMAWLTVVGHFRIVTKWTQGGLTFFPIRRIIFLTARGEYNES